MRHICSILITEIFRTINFSELLIKKTCLNKNYKTRLERNNLVQKSFFFLVSDFAP